MSESLIPSSAAIQSRLDEIEREKKALKKQLAVSLFVEQAEAMSKPKDDSEKGAMPPC